MVTQHASKTLFVGSVFVCVSLQASAGGQFQLVGKGFCRTADGGAGTYDRIDVHDCSECMAKCSESGSCVAIECKAHSWCELHSKPVSHVHPEHEYQCWKKVMPTECPASLPSSGDACPVIGMSCGYDAVACPDGSKPFMTYATCLDNSWALSQVLVQCPPAECPHSAPSFGDACHEDGMSCKYDAVTCSDGSTHFTTFAECAGSSWGVAQAMVHCPPAECPVSPPSTGDACYEDGMSCKYDAITCPDASKHFTTFATCAGSAWGVAQAMVQCPPAECPVSAPSTGDACDEDGMSCKYDAVTCSAGSKHWTTFATCAVSSWVLSQALVQCPPIMMESNDGTVCFTQAGIDIVNTCVGTKGEWTTTEDVVASFSTDAWLAFGPTQGEVKDCASPSTRTTTTTIKLDLSSSDGTLCFTQAGIDVVNGYVGTNGEWTTTEDVVASFATDAWLAFVPTEGEVVDCASKSTAEETAIFIGCNEGPHSTIEGVLTLRECQTRAKEKGFVYFGLNWGNHVELNHGNCHVQAAKPPVLFSSGCQAQTDHAGNYLGSDLGMAWYLLYDYLV